MSNNKLNQKKKFYIVIALIDKIKIFKVQSTI